MQSHIHSQNGPLWKLYLCNRPLSDLIYGIKRSHYSTIKIVVNKSDMIAQDGSFVSHPLAISQMSWYNALELLKVVTAQYHLPFSENRCPFSDLKAEKSYSEWHCQKPHNTSPLQLFWPNGLKFWYVVVCTETYKNKFWESHGTLGLQHWH